MEKACIINSQVGKNKCEPIQFVHSRVCVYFVLAVFVVVVVVVVGIMCVCVVRLFLSECTFQ